VSFELNKVYLVYHKKGGAMKEFKRVLAFVLTLVFIMSCFAFADVTTTKAIDTKEKVASIVSPEANSIVSSDSFLVSVKLNKEATIKVSVYEVKAVEKKLVIQQVSGSAVTKEAIRYYSFDTSTFEAIDFTSNVALDTAKDFLYTTPATYTSPKDAMGFYTNKVENVTPGMYKVTVEVVEGVKTKDEKTGKEIKTEKVIEKTSSLICVKEKLEKEVEVFSQAKEKTTALTVISNFLKSLFK